MNRVALWGLVAAALISGGWYAVTLLDQRAELRATLERLQAAHTRNAQRQKEAEARHRDQMAALALRSEREQRARLAAEAAANDARALVEQAQAAGAEAADPIDCLVTPLPGDWVPEGWRRE